MKRDYFSVRNEGEKLRIASRKRGVTEIYRIPNDDKELAEARHKHKTKKIFHEPSERKIYIPKIKEEKKEVDLVEYFYSNLNNKDKFLITDFFMQLFDSEGDRCFIFDCVDNEYKEQVQLAKFFLVENKFDETKFDTDENILCYYTKKLKGNYKILLLLPNIVFRDKRFAFEYPRYLQQISLNEVRSLWKNVNDFSYNDLEVEIGDIPKTKKSRKKMRDIAKEKMILVSKAKRLYMRITSKPAEHLENKVMIKISPHSKPVSKSYRMQSKMKSLQFALDRKKLF